jgi:uncharacterized membrane protein
VLDFLIDTLGFSVCHQLSARSLSIGNVVLPICSRCSGIYIGFTITALILFIMFRKKENDLPPPYALIILCLFFLSTIIDGIASNFGLYNTDNNLRFLTGFLCGSSIMIIIYPVFVFQYYKESKKEKIFKRPLKFMIYTLILTIFIAITLFRFNFLGHFYYWLSAFSILFTFYFINLVIMFLIPHFSQKATRLASKHLILPSTLSAALSLLELFVSYHFHRFIVTL